ncbi:uncharacterized protein L201_003897 [Kwoniella dendrophila CBS 6074]|uniref:Domain of unknown function at the cortex 1 domain-containing protein n=1 Tax=Kwoniella dendrophila CBS 6074 TaxID=1295534 RepID=A0AAX4JUC9_9TREE
MTPKLRASISSGPEGYPPNKPVQVNSNQPTKFETKGFSGKLWIFIKGYNGDLKQGDGNEYFGVKGREGMSYGIIVKGKFKNKSPTNSDKIVFGNVFEKSIKDNLPWGTSIATRFMYFIDPTVEADIYADKPWALSPTLATMAHLSLKSKSKAAKEDDDDKPYVDEDSLDWLKKNVKDADDIPSYTDEKSQIAARRKWFGKASNRQAVEIDADTEVGFEFCNGLLDFNTLSATLPSPFSLQIPLIKYWDGQPVTYVCQDKPSSKDISPVGINGDNGQSYWSVAFEIVDEELKANLQKKGGKVIRPGGGVEEESGEEGNNDDID